MKALVIASTALLFPGLSHAHGGHPEAGESHLLAHFLFFGLPVALLGVTALYKTITNRRNGI